MYAAMVLDAPVTVLPTLVLAEAVSWPYGTNCVFFVFLEPGGSRDADVTGHTYDQMAIRARVPAAASVDSRRCQYFDASLHVIRAPARRGVA